MRKTREPGVGGGGPEPPTNGAAPVPDNRQPTTDNVNWPLLYAAVIGELVILVIIFYAFTKAFA
ncbi:MAG TPA: hypothetical protein VN380_26220 [Thermoanaerobaculia bacterium]|jgi:hypothetical protein|nr:hypothetical protein [Thermoanaerobaculia bacterium]